MKKAVVLMAAVFVLLGMVGAGTANAVFALPETFSLADGKWSETYDGGGPGQAGNMLWAVSNDMSARNKDNVATATWSVSGLYLDHIISATPLSGGGMSYKTLYNGFNVLDPVNSGSDNSYGYYYEPGTFIPGQNFDQYNPGKVWTLTDLSAVVIANFDQNGTYSGQVTLTGNQTWQWDPPFIMTANLSEEGLLTNPDGHYGPITGIQVARVPEPATMLLLGLGLMSIAGIRRKS